MRDLRIDLSERLGSLDVRHAEAVGAFLERLEGLHREHKAEIDTITRERETIKALLAIEEGRLGNPSPQAQARLLMPLSDFLTATLSASGPMDKEMLRAEATAVGYFADGANGRTFHTTLMNLVKHGKIYQRGSDYAARAVPAFPLFHSSATEDGNGRSLM